MGKLKGYTRTVSHCVGIYTFQGNKFSDMKKGVKY